MATINFTPDTEKKPAINFTPDNQVDFKASTPQVIPPQDFSTEEALFDPYGGSAVPEPGFGTSETARKISASEKLPAWVKRYPRLAATVYEVGTQGLEAGALVGGGIVGAGAVPFTGGLSIPVGSALAFAGAKGITRKFGEFLGIEEPAKTFGEEVYKAGRDVQTGLAYEAGGLIPGAVVKGSLRAVNVVSPKAAKVANFFVGAKKVVKAETQRMLNLFHKYKAEPLISEVTTVLPKTLAMLEGVIGYTPIAGDVFYNNSASRLAQMNAVRTSLIEKNGSKKQLELISNEIRKEAKFVLRKLTAAKDAKLQGMVDDFMGRFGSESRYKAGLKYSEILAGDRKVRSDAASDLYDTIPNLLPKKGFEKIVLSEDTQTVATELLKKELAKSKGLRNTKLIGILRGYTKKPLPPELAGYSPTILARNPELQAMLDSYQPQKTWIGLEGDRVQLGDDINAILTSMKRGTQESTNLGKLKQAIDNEMVTYSEKIGGVVKQTLDKARAISSEMHTIYTKDMLKIMKESPEDIARSLLSGKNTITLLKNIKTAVGEKGLEPIRQNFFKETIDNATTNQILDYKKIARAIKKSGDVMEELLTPEQFKMINKIAEKGIRINERFGKAKVVNFLETLMNPGKDSVNFLIRPNNASPAYNIRMAKALLSKEELKNLEQGALQKVFKMSGLGDTLPVSSAKEFTKYENSLKELLDTETFRNVRDFINLGAKAVRVEKMAMNASQTGQIIIARGIIEGLKSNPLKVIKGLGMDWVFARVYTTKAARRLFTESIKLNPASDKAIQLFTKALEIAYFENKADFDEKFRGQQSQEVQ